MHARILLAWCGNDSGPMRVRCTYGSSILAGVCRFGLHEQIINASTREDRYCALALVVIVVSGTRHSDSQKKPDSDEFQGRGVECQQNRVGIGLLLMRPDRSSIDAYLSAARRKTEVVDRSLIVVSDIVSCLQIVLRNAALVPVGKARFGRPQDPVNFLSPHPKHDRISAYEWLDVEVHSNPSLPSPSWQAARAGFGF